MAGKTRMDVALVTQPQLNATPLIDVLLVLLAMLIFTLPIATHSLRLNLPQRAPGTPPPAVRLEEPARRLQVPDLGGS